MSGNVARGIKNIVREKGLRNQFVADKAGFTQQQFSDMINGRKLILAEYLPGLAQALGVTVMDIFNAGADEDETERESA